MAELESTNMTALDNGFISLDTLENVKPVDNPVLPDALWAYQNLSTSHIAVSMGMH